MNTDSFALRHIGPRENDLPQMLKTVGASTMDQLIYETVPDDILLKKALDLDTAMSEQEFLEHINELSTKNKLFKTYIGLGYNQSITPPAIQRNIFENPGWYTAYTPYQAEISQVFASYKRNCVKKSCQSKRSGYKQNLYGQYKGYYNEQRKTKCRKDLYSF